MQSEFKIGKDRSLTIQLVPLVWMTEEHLIKERTGICLIEETVSAIGEPALVPDLIILCKIA